MEVKSLFEYGLFGENSFIITDSGESAVVDPCFVGGRSLPQGLNIKYVLLTHGHIDHIGSALETASAYGAKIVACKNEKILLGNAALNLTASHGHNIEITPDILLNDGESVTLGSIEIKLMLTSGHTGGSCCYIVENHIFTGDTVMAGTIGRTDLPTANEAEMENSIKKIKAINGDYILHCGHGEDTTLNKEKAENPYFIQ